MRSWDTQDPGVVVRDLAVMLADGGTAIGHIARGADPTLFVRVASPPTAWRTIEALAADELALTRLDAARAAARRLVWDAGGTPPAVTATVSDPHAGPVCVCVSIFDTTLVTAHLGERPGRAQLQGRLRLPSVVALSRPRRRHRRVRGRRGAAARPARARVLARGNTAAATKAFLAHVRAADWLFSVSFRLSPQVKTAIRALREDAWTPATRQDGRPREGAAVAEITHLVDLGDWPADPQLVVRREPLHPGAPQTFDDDYGHRFTSCSPTSPTPT